MKDDLISLYQRAIGFSVKELAEEILSLAKIVSLEAQVRYRIKDCEILKRKMIIKGAKSVFNINDVYGVRILMPSIEKSKLILQMVVDNFSGVLDHDYISSPKTRPDKPHLKNKSLRLFQVVAYKNYISFEVQITTFEFDRENESLHEEYHREKYLL